MDQLTVGVAVTSPALAEAVRICLLEMRVRVIAEQSGPGAFGEFVERAGRLRPDVMMVELASAAGERDTQLHAVERIPGHPALVAIQELAEPEAIMAAMRAGAAEYLYPPFGGRIRSALERVRAERAARDGKETRARTAGFFSAKGGCGATTIVCHLAREFQRQTRHNLLLADFDLDAGMVRFLLKTKSPYSVLDAARNPERLDKSFWKALISNGTPRLEVIAAPELALSRIPAEESFLEVMRFARGHYDWVLADLGRSLNPRSFGMLEELDECYIVTTLDLPAMYQTKQVIRALLDGGYRRDRMRIVLNRVRQAEAVTAAEAESMLGTPVWASIPDAHAELEEAYNGGGLAGPSTALGAHYARLAARIAGLPEEPLPKRKFGLFGLF
jgi:pilus assembly protein CpaE